MLPLCQASPRRGHSPTPNPSPTALQESGARGPHGRLLEPHRLVPRLAERLDAQLSGGRLASGAARVLWADDVGVAWHEGGVGDANALGGRGAWEIARPGHRDAARRAMPMVLSPSCCARIQVSNLWLPTQRIFTAVCTSRSTDKFAQPLSQRAGSTHCRSCVSTTGRASSILDTADHRPEIGRGDPRPRARCGSGSPTTVRKARTRAPIATRLFSNGSGEGSFCHDSHPPPPVMFAAHLLRRTGRSSVRIATSTPLLARAAPPLQVPARRCAR